MNTTAPIPETEIAPFRSLIRMREAHTELIRRHRDRGSTPEPEFVEAVFEFIRRGRATGTLLDQDEDRCTAQGLLDYWLTITYRLGSDFPELETALEDFDLSRQPKLESSDCPYVGLEAFSEANADLLFGRQNLVKQWIAALSKRQVVAVVGPSGSGKASLISAGVIPALRSGELPGSENWRYLPLITPGTDPLRNVIEAFGGSAGGGGDELIAEMRRSSKVLLGLVGRHSDQPVFLAFPRFEEIFTLANADDRKALANNLLELVEAPDGHRVLVAIRNEFVTHFGQLGPFQAHLQKGEVFVPPFDAIELREVIEKPAERVGLKFEDGLVDALIFDVLGDPAALPLLQFTLLKLWDRRERNRITWRAFRKIGGCRGAIEQAAEEMFSRLDSSEREILKAILLRIVRPGAAREVICGTVRRASLYENTESDPRVDRVIDAIIRAGLVRTSKDDTAGQRLRVVHEALVTKWPRLVDWLEDERTKMRQRHRLAAAAAQWKEKQEDPGALWGGLLLEEARTYRDLNDLEQEFVDASVEVTVQRDRLRRRLKVAGAIALAAVIILLLLNVLQIWINLRNTRQALRMAYIERGMRLLDAGDPAGGAVWFAQLFKLKPPNDVKTDVYRRRLEIGLRQLPRLLQLLPHDREATYSEMSRDGRHVVTLTAGIERAVQPESSDSSWARGEKTAWLWKLKGDGSAPPHHLKGELPANGVCLSPSGSLVATAHGDDKGAGEIRIWDITRNEPACIQRLSLHGAVTLVAWSLDGNRVAFAQEIGATRGKVSVWDWKSETQPAKSIDHEDKIALLVWSPAGNAIALVDQQKGEARVWDMATLTPTLIPLKLETSINDVAFNSDGSRVVTAAGIQSTEAGPQQTETGAAQVWNTKTGERVGPPLPHKGAVLAAQFSPDDRLVVTASADDTAKVWSASSGRELLKLLHDGWVFSATFSPDGRHVATGGRDRMAHVWDLLSGQPAIPPMNHGGTVKKIAFSADGRRLITTSKETPRIWAFSTGIEPPPALNVDGPISSAAYSRDGRRIVTLSETESGKRWKAQVWDAQSGHLKSEYQHAEPLTRAALSDDGSRVLLGISDVDQKLHRALVLDASNGKPVFAPIALAGDPTFLAFGQGKANQFVCLIRDDKRAETIAQVWNAHSGKPLTKPLAHDVPVYFATFNPNNSRLLTTGGKHKPDAGKAFIWQVMNNDQRPVVFTHSELITHGEFSADGRRIVTASEDNNASVWRTAGGIPLSTLKNLHTADLTSVSFSPDGNRIVTASYDQTSVVADWRNHEIVSIFKHSGVVNSAQFSPDGKRVATASADGTTRLWDVKTNELIAVLKRGDSVRNAVFINDGNSLFTFSAAGGSNASFQKGTSISSVPDDVSELPRRTVLAQISSIAVDTKQSDPQAIAELLAARSYGPKERLDLVPTGKLVKNWQRLKVPYLTGLNEEAPTNYHARCAILSEAAKQWFAASWHLTKLLEKSPANPHLLQRRAMAYIRLRKDNLAVADLDKAIEFRPDDASLLSMRARVSLAMGNYDEAVRDCEKLVARRDASSASARVTLAAVRCKQERFDEAANQLRMIVDANPDDTAALQRLALVELKLGDFDSYKKTCARMLERFKDKVKLGSIISWPCVLSPKSVKDFSPIVELTRKAVEHSPTNYYRVNTLAGALYRAGKYSEALTELDRSRDLFLNSVTARIAALRDDSFLPPPSESRQGRAGNEPRHGRAVDWAFLAMANFQTKQPARAEWWLGKLKETVDGASIGTEMTADRQLWNLMELQILYQEAEALIHPAPRSAKRP